jgi:predicted nucleic acid-binding protein
VAQALDLLDQGFDFADALHLASSRRADAFATFDAALRRRARRVPDLMPLVAP